jgi:hypothetical protein
MPEEIQTQETSSHSSMSTFLRNNYRADHIRRFGQAAGTPLFDSAANKAEQTRFENAPKAIQTGDDTRKLSHTMLKADEMKLGDMQQLVLDELYKIGPATNEEIAQHLGLPINHVVGRTFELRQFGLVVSAGKRKCSVTGNIVHAWRVK